MKRLISIALLTMCGTAQAAFPHQSCFEVAARLHDVPMDLLLAVAATESAWDADARSTANAHGIMQIQWPGTARHLGVSRVAELYNPCLNIELGARYLAELVELSGGDVQRALASYNYGPTRIARAAQLPTGARTYVDKVLSHRRAIAASLKRGIDPDLVPGTAHALAHFNSALRARRYAAELSGRTQSVSFRADEGPEGGHIVTMVISENGISSSDATLLKALGLSS